MKDSRLNTLYKSAVPFGVGLFFFILSGRMTFGDWNNPGPGLWPTCLSAMIMIVSVVLFFTGSKTGDEESFTRDSRYPLYGILSLAIFILLFERIGFSLPCLIVFLFWTRYLGKEKWRVAIPVSAGLTTVIFLIFALGLDIPFPEDRLFLLFG